MYNIIHVRRGIFYNFLITSPHPCLLYNFNIVNDIKMKKNIYLKTILRIMDNILDEKTIILESISLSFDNEIVEVNGDCGCLYLRGLWSLIQEENKLDVKVCFDSYNFKNYILRCGLETDDFFNFTEDNFEKMFIEFGFFGAEKQLVLLEKICKKVLMEQKTGSREVRTFIGKILQEKKCVDSYFFPNWKGLNNNPNFDSEFFGEHPEYISYPELCKNEALDESFFNKHRSKLEDDECWKNLFFNRSISLKYIKTFMDEKNKDNFFNIEKSNRDDLNECFMEENKNFLNMKHMLVCGNFNAEYLEKLVPDINTNWWWGFLASNKYLSKQFIIKYLKKLKKYPHFWANPCVTLDIIENNIETVIWHKIANNINITSDFIRKYFHNLNAHGICTNPSVTEEILTEFQDELKSCTFVYGSKGKLSNKFLNDNKHNPKMMNAFCLNPNVPIEFFKQNQNLIYFYDLVSNKFKAGTINIRDVIKDSKLSKYLKL